MIDVALDAGHGGEAVAGSSTPTGVVGAGGALEKEIALAFALEAGELLRRRGLGVVLTRDGDFNLTLRERAERARRAGARAFVSLHLNQDIDPALDGCQTFHHARGRGALADTLHAALLAAGCADRGRFAAELAVLDPDAHAAGTDGCLVELAYLSAPDAERRLRARTGRAPLATALAEGLADFFAGVRRASAVDAAFDVWNEVPLVPQLSGMSCWAAAAAMLIGWRECVDVDPEEIARGAGRWEDYRDGLRADDIGTLARACGLTAEPIERLSVARLRELLEGYGPLWVGEAHSGLHVVVITGAGGDGTPDGTMVRVADPWPPGQGSRYTISFRELVRCLRAAAELVGVDARILHNPSGRGRSVRQWSEQSRFSWRLDRQASSG